ncbi:MAG: hypothetical protein KJO07_14245 [Deltaproteobacteria bacterium]|jgi:hypothetical protein|nr:hypothetical protein [Deltaproteobacteria bacterium]
MRILGLSLLVVAALGCAASASPEPGKRTSEPVETVEEKWPTCGRPHWSSGLRRDTPECEKAARMWLSLTDDDRQCTTDADCTLVQEGGCVAAVVSKSRESAFASHPAICWKHVEAPPDGGECAPPQAHCDNGCCTTY